MERKDLTAENAEGAEKKKTRVFHHKVTKDTKEKDSAETNALCELREVLDARLSFFFVSFDTMKQASR